MLIPMLLDQTTSLTVSWRKKSLIMVDFNARHKDLGSHFTNINGFDGKLSLTPQILLCSRVIVSLLTLKVVG